MTGIVISALAALILFIGLVVGWVIGYDRGRHEGCLAALRAVSCNAVEEIDEMAEQAREVA